MAKNCILIRLIQASVTIIVFLATIELCSRIEDAVRYGAPFLGEYSSDHLRSTDSEGIVHNVPNASFEKWHNNRFGFRGLDFDFKDRPGALKVACMGTSESYGLYESPGKEWPSQLGTMLDEKKFLVFNASIPGLDLSKYRSYLDKYVLPYSPDVVVLLVNPLRYATILERRGGKAEENSVSIRPIKPEQNTSLLAEVGPPHAIRKFKQILRNSIAETAPSFFKTYQERSMMREVVSAETLRLKGRPPKTKVPAEYIEKFKNDLSSLVEYLQRKNIKVVLCTYPVLMSRNNLNEYKEIFLDNRRFAVEYSFSGMIDVIERTNAMVTQVASEKETFYVDSFKFIPRDTDHFADNVHYTDNGARLFAEKIAAQLLNIDKSSGK